MIQLAVDVWIAVEPFVVNDAPQPFAKGTLKLLPYGSGVGQATIDHGRYQETAQIPSGPELAGFSETQLPLIVASDDAASIAGLLKSVVTNAIHGAKILEAGGSRHDGQEAAQVICRRPPEAVKQGACGQSGFFRGCHIFLIDSNRKLAVLIERP